MVNDVCVCVILSTYFRIQNARVGTSFFSSSYKDHIYSVSY